VGGPEGAFGKGAPVTGPMHYLYAFVRAAKEEAVLADDFPHAHTVEGREMREGLLQVFGGAAGSVDFMAVVRLYQGSLPVRIGGKGMTEGCQEHLHEADPPGEVTGK